MRFPRAVDVPDSPAYSIGASAACRARMEVLLERVDGRVSAVLAGPDGFELSAVVSSELNAPKLAALSSTMTAVGDALARETGLAECTGLIIETAAGSALVHAVPVGGQRFSLILVCKDRTVLGKLLVISRDCAGEIAEELKRWS